MSPVAQKPPSPPQRCPICGKPTEERWRPFCSKRCADVDLNRWLGGRYRIETDEGPDDKPDSTPPSGGGREE